jgi:hypothetical protein
MKKEVAETASLRFYLGVNICFIVATNIVNRYVTKLKLKG